MYVPSAACLDAVSGSAAAAVPSALHSLFRSVVVSLRSIVTPFRSVACPCVAHLVIFNCLVCLRGLAVYKSSHSDNAQRGLAGLGASVPACCFVGSYLEGGSRTWWLHVTAPVSIANSSCAYAASHPPCRSKSKKNSRTRSNSRSADQQSHIVGEGNCE